VTPTTRTFAEVTEQNPCAGCPAPCCRMQLVPYPPPRTAFDIDHVRYMLLFPGTEFIISTGGDWSVLSWRTCSLLDSEHCTCTVHGTVEQPRICASYNAHNCWYRRNFVTDTPQDIYRLSLERFDAWVEALRFDEHGALVMAPCFEDAQALVRPIPIAPHFTHPGGIVLEQDIRVARQHVAA